MTNPTDPPEEHEPQPDLPVPDTIDEEIERLVGEVIPPEEGEKGAKLAARIVTVVKHESFSGPLPPPRYLQAYDDIAPGTAVRIIEMATKQQDHNIDMDRTSLEGEIRDRRLGMWLGAGLFIILVVAALYAGMNKNNVLAGFFLGAVMLNAIGLFINGRK